MIVAAAVIIAGGLVFHGLCLLAAVRAELTGRPETPWPAPLVEKVRRRVRRDRDTPPAPKLPIGL